MRKYEVILTKTVEVEIDDGEVKEHERKTAAIVVAKFFLDHEEEDEEESRQDLPMRVSTQYVGTVTSYDWNISAKKA